MTKRGKMTEISGYIYMKKVTNRKDCAEYFKVELMDSN